MQETRRCQTGASVREMPAVGVLNKCPSGLGRWRALHLQPHHVLLQQIPIKQRRLRLFQGASDKETRLPNPLCHWSTRVCFTASFLGDSRPIICPAAWLHSASPGVLTMHNNKEVYDPTTAFSLTLLYLPQYGCRLLLSNSSFHSFAAFA